MQYTIFIHHTTFAIKYIIICCRFIDAHGNLSVKPENVAVLAGATCSLNCRTNMTMGRIVWHYYAKKTNLRFLYNGFNISTKAPKNYEILANFPGQFYLSINFVNVHHAGCYTCEEAKSLISVTAQLIVIGKNTVVKYTVILSPLFYSIIVTGLVHTFLIKLL